MKIPPFPRIILDGITYKDYFLTHDDRIISIKSGRWEYLKIFDSGKKPRVKIMVEGRDFSSTPGPTEIHRIICETLNPFPIPPGITDEDWYHTPQSIKNILNSTDYWEVNHIDHNNKNYHRLNLEWVTRKQNRKKAIEFYNKNNGWFDKEAYAEGLLPKNTLRELISA